MTSMTVMIWMKKEAYEDTTIKATAKRLRYLQKNCTPADSVNIKTFKRKQNLLFFIIVIVPVLELCDLGFRRSIQKREISRLSG